MAAKKQGAPATSKTTASRSKSGSKVAGKASTSGAKAASKSTSGRSKTRSPDKKTRFTENHRVIRRWAERRGGTPATVKGTRRKGDPAGILRIDFPGYSGEETLKAIPWEDFFAKFDEADLALLYQNQTADGSESRFCKFIHMADARAADAEQVTGIGPRGGRKAKTTTNHRVIRRWAERRGGTPATVKGTRRKGDPAGILRIDFPGYSGEETLKAIPWEDFFAKFDEARLLFLYQDKTADGSESRFCKFVHMDEG